MAFRCVCIAHRPPRHTFKMAETEYWNTIQRFKACCRVAEPETGDPSYEYMSQQSLCPRDVQKCKVEDSVQRTQFSSRLRNILRFPTIERADIGAFTETFGRKKYSTETSPPSRGLRKWRRHWARRWWRRRWRRSSPVRAAALWNGRAAVAGTSRSAQRRRARLQPRCTGGPTQMSTLRIAPGCQTGATSGEIRWVSCA